MTEEERPAGKGRPTPKRKDARKQRRQALPANRKEATKLRRERAREQRTLQRQALLSGDERHLPARDAGPAKRLARDVVDTRFTLGQIFFALIFVVLGLSIGLSNVRGQAGKTAGAAVNLASIVVLIVVFVDSVRVGKVARKAVVDKYGAKEALGITGYAMIRAMQPRRMRRPPPKLHRGDDL